MDGDRRIKTVTAGTFAISRKSLSNAQPISADETQRTKAEMTMASPHMPTLHEARAERHLRRVSNHNLRMDRTVSAGTHTRARCDQRHRAHGIDGVGCHHSKDRPQGGPGGKIGRSPRALAFAPRYLQFFLFHNPAKFFEVLNV
jgi:hypothetical protein